MKQTEEEKLQIGKWLMLTNNNSPLSLKLKDITTMGIPSSNYIKLLQHRCKPFYNKSLLKDKLTNLAPDLRKKLVNPEKAIYEIQTEGSKTPDQGTCLRFSKLSQFGSMENSLLANTHLKAALAIQISKSQQNMQEQWNWMNSQGAENLKHSGNEKTYGKGNQRSDDYMLAKAQATKKLRNISIKKMNLFRTSSHN